MILFMIHVKPFEVYKMNYQEIVNETFVLIAAYVMLLYSEFVPDYDMRYYLRILFLFKTFKSILPFHFFLTII